MQLIRELSSISCWRLVSPHLNPADIVSRGFLLNDLVKSEVWFNDPTLQLMINLILILAKEMKNVRLIQFITKTVMPVYKTLLYTLF